MRQLTSSLYVTERAKHQPFLPAYIPTHSVSIVMVGGIIMGPWVLQATKPLCHSNKLAQAGRDAINP